MDMFPDGGDPSTPGAETPVDGDDDNMLLGQPSSESGSLHLLEHEGYTVMYSYDLLMPIWVSWHLDADDTGDGPRKEDFRADPLVPEEYAVDEDDYKYTGFSRGHLCPDADRKGDETLQLETYLMTNMVPQNQSLNGGDWSQLEGDCRELANSGYELYIVAGAVTGERGGCNEDDVWMTEFESESSGKVLTVPSKVWKAIIAIEQDDSRDDLERIEDGETEVYAVAVIFDNAPFDGEWEDAIVSIDEVEALVAEEMGVSLDLFSLLPDGLERSLESAAGSFPKAS